MTMLANRTDTRALTLADYEARIHLYKEQIGTGYIGIGRTLLEAKEAKVVPHGQWESWVTETTGLTPRQAQRCMQAATEIKDGTAMARLEMSKALLLLSSGLDAEQQEEIAGKAVEEGATVKDLREQLRKAKLQIVQETGAATEIREELKKAEEERDQIEGQMREMDRAYKARLEEAREDAYKRGEMAGGADAAAEIRRLKNNLEQNKQIRQSLQDRLNSANRRADDQNSAARSMMNERDVLQNELNKQKQYADELQKLLDEKEEEYQRMLRQCDEEARAEERKKIAAEAMPADYAKDREILMAAAEEAEKRAADAEAELEMLRANGAGQPDPAWKVLKKATDIFMSDCEMLAITDIKGLLREEKKVRGNLDYLEAWIRATRDAMAGAVEAEGAVE